MTSPGEQPQPTLKVSLGTTPASRRNFSFTSPFRIGRADDCEVCIKNEYVSRVHAEVVFENGRWWVHDLQSSNGIYLDGGRVERIPITRPLVLWLGIEGPQLSFEPESVPTPNYCRVTNLNLLAVAPFCGNTSSITSTNQPTMQPQASTPCTCVALLPRFKRSKNAPMAGSSRRYSLSRSAPAVTPGMSASNCNGSELWPKTSSTP